MQVVDGVGTARTVRNRSFESIYKEHVGRVYARFLRFADTKREAEDLTQETFVRAFTRIDTFRGESALSTWLERIAINVAMETLRSKVRRENWIEAVPDPAARERNPESAPPLACAGEVAEALAALPKGARAVLVLHDVEGYRHEEIANLLDITVGTSKSQLHRARKLFKEALER
jgi:RNA polymerase sigma-70 factor (ECF subfamily)